MEYTITVNRRVRMPMLPTGDFVTSITWDSVGKYSSDLTGSVRGKSESTDSDLYSREEAITLETLEVLDELSTGLSDLSESVTAELLEFGTFLKALEDGLKSGLTGPSPEEAEPSLW